MKITRRRFLRSMAYLVGIASTTALLQACTSPDRPDTTPEVADPTATVKSPSPTPRPSSTPAPSPTPTKMAEASPFQRVSVLRCAPEASDREIEERLAEATAQVMDLEAALRGKRKVFIKPNMAGRELAMHRGRLHAITDPGVLRGVVALLRRHYDGEIVVGEAPTTRELSYDEVFAAAGHSGALKDLKVRTADLNQPPFTEIAVPGGGLMFSSYTLSQELADVDFVISVAKMKSHVSTGVTLTLKNLFGLPPIDIYGCPRRYLHSVVRLPRVLADLGLIFRPNLCVLDGLVSQNAREWGGPPVDTEVLMVGDNTVATDAVAARFMGVDPLADYGQPPYLWDRNPIVLAHEAKLGSAASEDIEVLGDDWSSLPRHRFYVERELSSEQDEQRRSLAAQARVYLARRDEWLEHHRGRIICIQDGEVAHVVDDASSLDFGPRKLGHLLWSSEGMGSLVKRVLPADEDPERFEVYEEYAS